jgi:hypothetical protein
MGFLDFLTGGSQIDTQHGVDINKGDFQIKDADKLFGQTQDQYQNAQQRGQGLNEKSSSFLNTLEGSANGTAPSLSSAMLKQAQDRNLQQQLAMAQSQRGGNPAALQRELLRSQSAGAANTAQQGVTAGLQEQQQNRQLYQQELGRQQSAVDQLTQQYLGMGFNIRQAQEQALADYNHLNVQQALGLAQINSAGQMQQAGAQNKLVGGLFSAAGSALMPMGGATSGGLQAGSPISTGGSAAPSSNPFLQALSSGKMLA